MRRTVLVLALVPLVLPPAAHAAAPTCDGRAATIVAQPGSTVIGTSGDDVIVTDGAQKVDGGAGDDTICVTGGTFYTLDGPGDDTIDASENPIDGAVYLLGLGDDTLIGSPRGDQVQDSDGGSDTIRTGGGRDVVHLDEHGAGDPDRISLGAGDDIVYADDLAVGSTLDGGAGRDLVEGLDDLHRGAHGAWRYDVAHGVTRDGVHVADWSGFEVYELDLGDVGSAEFVGDGHRQLVATFGAAPTRIDLAGGDDLLVTDARVPGMVVDGGAGHDTVEARSNDQQNPPTFVGDLASGVLRTIGYDGHRVATARVRGVEDLTAVRFVRAGLTGDAGPNRLRLVDVCGTASATGGGGADVLGSSHDADATAFCHGAHLSGGPGDDVLVGDDARDVLVGGAGHDTARGGPGRDHCVAEDRVGCEGGSAG